tara:strand:- start:290 stop:607 length:318 start_codon:yes stop_codon:yes gene_type:complete
MALIGFDVGGTFTNLCLYDDQNETVSTVKTATTMLTAFVDHYVTSLCANLEEDGFLTSDEALTIYGANTSTAARVEYGPSNLHPRSLNEGDQKFSRRILDEPSLG